jgi:hypothetical protein
MTIILTTVLIQILFLCILCGWVHCINEVCTYGDTSKVIKGGHLAGWFIPGHCSTINIYDVKFGKFELKYFARTLEKMELVKSLRFASCSISDDSLLTLLPGIRKLSQLKELDLSGNGLRSSGLRKLFDEIKNLKNMEKLNLEGNHFAIEDLPILESTLSSLPQLSHCDVRGTFASNFQVGVGIETPNWSQVSLLLDMFERLQKKNDNLHILHDVQLAQNFGDVVSNEKVQNNADLKPVPDDQESSNNDEEHLNIGSVRPELSDIPLHSSIMETNDIYEFMDHTDSILSHSDKFFRALEVVDWDHCSFISEDQRRLTDLLIGAGLVDMDSLSTANHRFLVSLNEENVNIDGHLVARLMRCTNVFKCIQNIVLSDIRHQFDRAEGLATCERLYYDSTKATYTEAWKQHTGRGLMSLPGEEL